MSCLARNGRSLCVRACGCLRDPALSRAAAEAPMGLRDRLIDPSSPERRPRRAAYALPTLFTAGNIFLGYIAVLRSFRGASLAASNPMAAQNQFLTAAIAIGIAAVLDGFDG